MIAALLQKAFPLEMCDFLLEEKAEAFPLSSLLFSTTQNHGRGRPCASEKGLSRHSCFQGPALIGSGFIDIKITIQTKLELKIWDFLIFQAVTYFSSSFVLYSSNVDIFTAWIQLYAEDK